MYIIASSTPSHDVNNSLIITLTSNLCVDEYDPLSGDYNVHTHRSVQSTLIRLLTLRAEHKRPRGEVNKLKK